jgi:hypothetical protein
MNKTQLQQLVPLSVLLVSISTIATSMGYKTGLPVANTTVLWLVQSVVLCLFFMSKKHFFDRSQAQAMVFIQWYLWWNMFSVLRGVFIAENYWDWKFLVDHTMALLIPIMAYSASNKLLMQSILRFYIKYGLPLFAVLAFLILPDAYGYYLVPVSFLTLFFPILPLRWKLILLALAILAITADLNARSNVIKYSIPVLLGFIYYLRRFISKTLFEWIRKLLFITPLLLFSLAVTDTFNVFKMDDYISGDYSAVETTVEGETGDVNLKADTRTFLYVEVLETAEKYNSWWIGRSPARGNDSSAFGLDDPTGRGERAGNEVAILNIFTWTGIVGVALYLLIFYKASYLAINQSNNIFSKILGLFIAFRWLYAWVEDMNSFSLTTVFLWFMLGLCFSKSFRAMNNKEVEYWVRGIFDKRYVSSMG